MLRDLLYVHHLYVHHLCVHHLCVHLYVPVHVLQSLFPHLNWYLNICMMYQCEHPQFSYFVV